MKKFSFALNILLIGFIIFNACNSNNTSERVATDTNAMMTNRTATLNLDDTSKICYDCTNDVFYGLTKREFLTGVARYGVTHADLVNDDYNRRFQTKGFEDARSCWYSFDTLLKFMCLIQNYSKCVHLKTSELGIRFYYAVYDHSNVWNQDYASHHTLFMIPTYGSGGNNIDFDPRSSCDSLKPVPLGNIADTKDILVLDGSTANHRPPPNQPNNSGIMPKNQGELCPPSCTPSSLLNAANPYSTGY